VFEKWRMEEQITTESENGKHMENKKMNGMLKESA
jgi:hypothetical protein